MDRRDFLHSIAGLALGAWHGGQTNSRFAPGPLPTRRLGQTDLELPILGLGGFHLGEAGSERNARVLVETAIEEGIRFFDNAESYQSGRAEQWMGAALAGVRDQVVLMTKTFDLATRSAEVAQRHLDGSLSRLKTDYLDLWQLHSVRTAEDVDRAFRPGGAMELMLQAKEQRTVRYVGVTGHADPAANLRTIEYFDRGFRFDAMQFPINPIDFHQRSFQRQLLPELERRSIGVIAMKTSAQARLARERICSIDECLRYVWSLPVDVAVVGMERPGLVRHNAQLARDFAPMDAAALDRLRARIAPHARLELEWYKG